MKTNAKSFKIVSRFYVIYGDDDPVYVGYTNRTVKQRFKEHKKDKDFSDYENIEAKELIDEKLSFDFTWDYEQTCKNADQVSLREGQLVQQYGTQDSVFQKADGGGQTWTFEKWFVRSNKNNPKFTGMSGTEIKSRIKKEKTISVDLCNFINNMNSQYQVDIGDFVSHMKPQYQVDVGNFVNHMKYQYQVDIGNFVNSMNSQYQVDISDFVSHMKSQYQIDVSDFINNMNPQYQVDIHNFVNSMRSQYQVDICSFVNHMNHQYRVDIGHFVSHMEPQYRADISDFINRMKYQYQVDISNFVNNMKWRER